ncbi:MAG: ATPase, T2SS/T4P/T4SS family [Candidatus Omnitrophica bacterium]|nr:ATPase, T2SS/T4P/T4SS family [Candidatus Omnitrophota bacterium]
MVTKNMASLKDYLTEILINNRLLTWEQLSQALSAQKENGGCLRDAIIGLNFIKEEELDFVLSRSLGLPLIDLKHFRIDPDIVKIIPINIARRYKIVPVSKTGDMITLAMADPLNIFTVDHVSSLGGYKINPVISDSQDILRTIDFFFSDSIDSSNELLKVMSAPPLELVKEEKEVSPSDQELNLISRQAQAIQVTNMIIEEGVRSKASDILIEPFSNYLRVRFRIDRVLREEKTFSKNIHPAIVSRIKAMSDLNIAEHRLPQSGRFKLKFLIREVDFRVSILPCVFGEKVAICIMDKTKIALDIEKLGFSQHILADLEKAAKLPQGLILVCGPAGSGKTATLYSLAKFIDASDKNIVTVEDPVEYRLEGVNQVTVRPDIGLTFAFVLHSILKQDPNVIMVSEMRDYETVDIAVKSALTGHLVISTMGALTAAGAIVNLVNMGVEPYLVNSSLVCVVAQRLVRKICSHCKEEYTIKKELLNILKIKLNGIKDPRFFRAKGCLHCFNTGYNGETGIAEAILLSDTIRKLILENAPERMIKEQARREGMHTLREDGIAQALKGLTSLEEVFRVTAPDELVR